MSLAERILARIGMDANRPRFVLAAWVGVVVSGTVASMHLMPQRGLGLIATLITAGIVGFVLGGFVGAIDTWGETT